MKIKNKLIIAYVFFASMFFGLSIIFFAQLEEISARLNRDILSSVEALSEDIALHDMANLVRYLDEVLTQSVRNYVFSQNKLWEHRYQAFKPELDRIIEKALEKAGGTGREAFKEVARANRILVDMEYNALRNVNEGKVEAAVKIMGSKAYWAQKYIYANQLRTFFANEGVLAGKSFEESLVRVKLAVKHVQQKLERDLQSALLIFIGFLFMALFGSFYLIRSVTKPIQVLTDYVGGIDAADWSQPVPVSSKDEIGHFAVAFQQLKKKLNLATDSLKKRAAELTETNAMLERFNRTAVGREERMIELKRQINELSRELGRESPYDLSFTERKVTNSVRKE